MRYEGRVFRPPSEAYSLIIQATVGCSHNKCAFCDMYKEKQFHIRRLPDILEDLDMARAAYGRIERIFLADGDALIMRTAELLGILEYIRRVIPECERVGIYGSPKSILLKSSEDLLLLRDAGIGIVYLGLESGCEAVLTRMNKGESAADIVAAGRKIKTAGMALSVTVISGLGGMEQWREHAVDSAAALSAMNPHYIGLLTLMVDAGTPLSGWVSQGSFTVPSALEVAAETRLLLEQIDSPGSVFRSNHASNYVALAGTLNTDREAMIAKLDQALTGQLRLRGKNERGF